MVKAAIQQSLFRAIDSLIDSYTESNGENAKQQIVLKACVLQLSESRFSFEVESVTVTKKITFTDDDFEAVEIDLETSRTCRELTSKRKGKNKNERSSKNHR